jgi:hypothetical protein
MLAIMTPFRVVAAFYRRCIAVGEGLFSKGMNIINNGFGVVFLESMKL